MIVLPGDADMTAQLEMPHRAKQFAGGAVAREMHPIMAGEPGLVHKRSRTVTRSVATATWSRNSGMYSRTDFVQSRRSSLCRSATAVAVNDFVIEPMTNCVEGVIGRFSPTSRSNVGCGD